VADEVIARRCLYAAINGTAALAEAAPDLDARTLDAIWTTRLGFPRWKGGPLFQGALVGHATVVAELEAWRRTRDTAGAPSPLLGRLLADLA
jgi:3-hydroxyacyl-CoA dehydrogenase